VSEFAVPYVAFVGRDVGKLVDNANWTCRGLGLLRLKDAPAKLQRVNAITPENVFGTVTTPAISHASKK
jgi:hypothetical protein